MALFPFSLVFICVTISIFPFTSVFINIPSNYAPVFVRVISWPVTVLSPEIIVLLFKTPVKKISPLGNISLIVMTGNPTFTSFLLEFKISSNLKNEKLFASIPLYIF